MWFDNGYWVYFIFFGTKLSFSFFKHFSTKKALKYIIVLILDGFLCVIREYPTLALKIPHLSYGLVHYFYGLCGKFLHHNQSHSIYIYNYWIGSVSLTIGTINMWKTVNVTKKTVTKWGSVMKLSMSYLRGGGKVKWSIFQASVKLWQTNGNFLMPDLVSYWVSQHFQIIDMYIPTKAEITQQ